MSRCVRNKLELRDSFLSDEQLRGLLGRMGVALNFHFSKKILIVAMHRTTLIQRCSANSGVAA